MIQEPRANKEFKEFSGEQGIQGPQGEAFTIKKTYSSIAAMNADFNNMQVNDYVMIANSVEIEDNAKLYVRGEEEWIFITDFSGATGIQGEQRTTRHTGSARTKRIYSSKRYRLLDVF